MITWRGKLPAKPCQSRKLRLGFVDDNEFVGATPAPNGWFRGARMEN